MNKRPAAEYAAPTGPAGNGSGMPCVDSSRDSATARSSAAGPSQHSQSADTADELETEYRIQQSVHLVAQLPTLIIGNSFAALSGFLFSVDYLPRWQSLTWLAIPALTIPMLLNWLKLRHAPRPQRVSHRRMRVATFHSGLMGIAWVAVTMGALPQVPTLNQLGLIFGLIVLSMGAVASISALPFAALAYFIPMMTLAFVGTLVRGTLPYKPVTLLSGFLFIALIAFLRQNVATFRRSVVMTIEQRRLAMQRAAEVQRRTVAEQEMRVAKEAAEQSAEELRAMHRRLQTELDAARVLQIGMLPRTFPAWSIDRPVDVYAVMEPAREVGGDLYDCFYAGDDLFCFMVGDVSGKGAPAAMFMARTSGLARLAVHAWQEYGTAKSSYGSVVQAVNRELCQNNAEKMFVTLFLGFLDIRSGTLSYINAGHPHPYLLQANGLIEVLASKPQRPLGVRRDTAYEFGTVALQPGDALLLYTDGVTEAMDEAGRFYTAGRLSANMPPLRGATAEKIVGVIKEQVDTFLGSTPKADDVTILAMRWRPGSDAQ